MHVELLTRHTPSPSGGLRSRHPALPPPVYCAGYCTGRQPSVRAPRPHVFFDSCLPLLWALEQPQIWLKAKPPVARIAGDLAQQADGFEAVDDLVRAGRCEAQPFAHGGDRHNGVVEEMVHHALAVAGGAHMSPGVRLVAEPMHQTHCRRFVAAKSSGCKRPQGGAWESYTFSMRPLSCVPFRSIPFRSVPC